MSLKEKPLIDAVSKLGAHPRFIFSTPIFTGVVTMFMVAATGATLFVFLGGDVHAKRLYDIARLGAYCAQIFAFFCLIPLTLLAPDQEDFEIEAREQFNKGCGLGFLIILVTDALTYFPMQSVLNSIGSVVHTP